MGLFFKREKKKSSNELLTREDKLKANEGIPFTTEILDDKKNGETLSYKYDKVKCKKTGDTSGLIEGAILYARRDGVLVNVLKEIVAQIDNLELRQMVNDLLDDKGRLSSVRVKYLLVEDDTIYCNMGFWTASDKDDFEEDIEDDE